MQDRAPRIGIAILRITSDVNGRKQTMIKTTEAEIEIVLQTVESDIARMITAGGLKALVRIAMMNEETALTANTVTGTGMTTTAALAAQDTIGTRNIEAIDHPKGARYQKSAGYAKLPNAARSSSSSRTAFSTKSKVRRSVLQSLNS